MLSKIESFVREVVDKLNICDDSVISIVCTNEHAFSILQEISETYCCSLDFVQWDKIAGSEDVIISIFNDADYANVAAQPLVNPRTEKFYMIGADYTFVDVDANLDFINTQGKDFEFQTFDLDTDHYNCNGDCCVCDYFTDNIDDIDSDTTDSLHQLMCEVIDALL